MAAGIDYNGMPEGPWEFPPGERCAQPTQDTIRVACEWIRAQLAAAGRPKTLVGKAGNRAAGPQVYSEAMFLKVVFGWSYKPSRDGDLAWSPGAADADPTGKAARKIPPRGA